MHKVPRTRRHAHIRPNRHRNCLNMDKEATELVEQNWPTVNIRDRGSKRDNLPVSTHCHCNPERKYSVIHTHVWHRRRHKHVASPHLLQFSSYFTILSLQSLCWQALKNIIIIIIITILFGRPTTDVMFWPPKNHRGSLEITENAPVALR